MRLGALIDQALGGGGLLVETRGDLDVEIRDVTMDSRAVQPGSLFACVPGGHVDGHTFAPVARRAGAVALLVQRPLDLPGPQVVVTSVRAALGPLAAAVNGDPSRQLTVVGVTGTNGKTTTCALLAQIFAAHGWPASVIGTLTQARTTPEAPELQCLLARMREAGQRVVAMEVSSHALDQHRVDGVHFAVGVFTNLTQDHLDYHGTMDRYFAAKARLFDEGRTGVAVVNRDDPWGQELRARLEQRGAVVVDYGVADAEDLEVTALGSRWRWRGVPMSLPIGGRFNVQNALAAATAAEALGVPASDVATGLAHAPQVRGRFERVDAGQDFTVLVDYAHTPDGLAKALAAARELTDRRLFVVFGAGGDRDHEKRAPMGEVAARLADLAVVTSDNPRSEDPDAIIEQVVAGAADRSRVRVIADRAQAIETALAVAAHGDVVVIAGKGHETGQEIAGTVRPFDDAEVVRQVLGRLVAARRQAGADR